MQSSMFNLRVPLPAHDEVFLMNTMSDAQLIVSSDVAALLDRYATEQPRIIADSEREAVDLLEENGFLVENRAAEGCSSNSIRADHAHSCDDGPFQHRH